MASKRRNMFYENKKQETTEIAACGAEGFNCLEMPTMTEWKSLLKMAKSHGHLINRRPPNLLGDPNYNESVKFYLYTSENLIEPARLYTGDVGSLARSHFNKLNPTKIIVHGYINSVDSDVIQDIKNAFFSVGDFNVIGVDWGLISNTFFYHMAAEQTEPVGHYLGAFIEFLLGQGVRPEDVHLIGHSLGAHVAGFASASLGPIKLARISGLDPAKPCFHNSPPELRLDAGDALFVDCIHTCGGYLGLIEPICQADFYPNGGVDTQPGCLLITAGICSHGRSHDYYAESIKRGHRFSTVKCPGIPSEDISRCKRSINLMGYSASPSMPGIFYSSTRESYPFAYSVEV